MLEFINKFRISAFYCVKFSRSRLYSTTIVARFDSLARSQPFGSGDPLFTPSRVLGSLRRSLGFIFLTFHLFFLNSRRDVLYRLRLQHVQTEQPLGL
jgi:hypothetical protein